MAAPSSPSNLILILPFTPSVLLWSTPLLSTIYSTVRRHPTLASLLVYFSTPGAESSAQGEHDQLYDDLRARPRATWSTFQRFLSVIYSTLAAAQWEGAGDGDGRIGVRVDVGFEGVEGRWGSRFEECDVALVLQGHEQLPHPPLPSSTPKTVLPSPKLSSLITSTFDSSPREAMQSQIPDEGQTEVEAAYPVVALGGTFDHLHAAHKLLLHSAFFLARRKLIVGVISPSLLASKAHADFVEPLRERMEGVREFLESLGGVSTGTENSGKGWGSGSSGGVKVGERRVGGEEGGEEKVELEIVEIHDAFGPTATDPDIQALVISDETRSGGDAVNELRRGKGWGQLDVWCIEVISGRRADGDAHDAHVGHDGGGGGVEGAAGPSSATSAVAVAADDNASGGRVQTVNDTSDPSTSTSRINGYEPGNALGAGTGGGQGAAGTDADVEVRTQSLKGLDEKTLKEVKMGSTGIRAWLAAKAKERNE